MNFKAKGVSHKVKVKLMKGFRTLPERYLASSMFLAYGNMDRPSVFSIAGESVWLFQALCREPVMRFRKFRCSRQRDMR